MSLTQEQLIAAINSKNGRFRVDKIKLTTPERTFRGSGILECGEKVELTITLPRGVASPALPIGTVARKDFWKLKGIIEETLSVSVDAIMPSGHTHSGRGYDEITFRIDEFDIVPDSIDRMTAAQVDKMLGKEQATENISKAPKPKKNQEETRNWEATFFCVLKNYKIFAPNGGTKTTTINDFLGERSSSNSDTFMGELPNWKYGLIQVGDDLHVRLRSDKNYESKSVEEDRKHFDAFLKAIAFTHGQHAWFSQIEYRRRHQMLTNKIRILKEVPKTPHTPFNGALWFNGHIGKIDWSLAAPLELAYRFFLEVTTLSEDINDLLYLFREAGADGVPIKVELLTLCSLYESLMRSVFASRSKERSKSPNAIAFIKSRDKIIGELKKRRGNKHGLEGDAFSRLISIIASSSGKSIREIVTIVTSELIPKSSINWSEIHKEWSAFRNPLSHTLSGRMGQKDNFRPDILAVSRIAGAINVIILKLMGYSGYARISTFEDKYQII